MVEIRTVVMVEIRTAAGPLSTVQWVFSGGPYTVWSQVAGGVHVFQPAVFLRWVVDGAL
jgi:hypothetical protein